MKAGSILLLIVFIILGLFLLNEIRFLVWSGFGIPAAGRGININCGSESRYKFDVSINNAQDVVEFLKTKNYRLDNYKNYTKQDFFKEVADENGRINQNKAEIAQLKIKNTAVEWDKVLAAIKVEDNGAFIFKEKIYSLNYVPDMCSEFTLRITSSGHVSIQGCCGK